LITNREEIRRRNDKRVAARTRSVPSAAVGGRTEGSFYLSVKVSIVQTALALGEYFSRE
jgi:hypothetical protein